MRIPLITNADELPEPLRSSLSNDERAAIAKAVPPFAVTPFYAGLAGPRADDPIRRQCIPDPREATISPGESPDPLGAHRHQVTRRLVHQYPSRVLLLSTGRCAGYCRHCFRRDWELFTDGWLNREEIAEACAYIASHPQVDEVLVSGGDPLSADNAQVESLLTALRAVREGLVIRLGTRLPVTWPFRVDDALVELLARLRPLRLILHINHPRELAPEVAEALQRLVDRGIPVHTQTVLLKGVNDDADTLADLFRRLVILGASPYYLFQGDLARGTGHLRTDLSTAVGLYRVLSERLSPLALPTLAVDLPGGLGKKALPPDFEPLMANGAPYPAYRLVSRTGEACLYPRDGGTE